MNDELTPEIIKLLREIADYGLEWAVGSRQPTISIPPNSLRDVDPDLVAELMGMGILEAELRDVLTQRPEIRYSLTLKGENFVIGSFQGLKWHNTHLTIPYKPPEDLDFQHKFRPIESDTVYGIGDPQL